MQLREMPTDADFDLTDPYSPPPRYNVLHDPHLKEYFQNQAMRRRLVEKGTFSIVSISWSRFRGRRAGVMVGAQDCGPSGPGSSPDHGHYQCLSPRKSGIEYTGKELRRFLTECWG